jgi:hypothetical protein
MFPLSQAFPVRAGAGATVHVARAGKTLRPAAALAFQTDARAAVGIEGASYGTGAARRFLPPELLEHVDHPLNLAGREVPVLHETVRVPVVHVVENRIETRSNPLMETCKENDFASLDADWDSSVGATTARDGGQWRRTVALSEHVSGISVPSAKHVDAPGMYNDALGCDGVSKSVIRKGRDGRQR